MEMAVLPAELILDSRQSVESVWRCEKIASIDQLDDANERTEIEALIALIDQRRNELQEEARVLGLRIYADKPRVLASRAEAYWRAWRAEIKHDPIRVG